MRALIKYIILAGVVIFSSLSFSSCARKACPAQTHEYQKPRSGLFNRDRGRNRDVLFHRDVWERNQGRDRRNRNRR